MASSSKKSEHKTERDQVRLVCSLPSSASFDTQWFYILNEETFGPYRNLFEVIMAMVDADVVVEYTVESL